MKNHIKTIKKDDFIVLLFQLICMHNLNDDMRKTNTLNLKFVMYSIRKLHSFLNDQIILKSIKCKIDSPTFLFDI